MNIKTREKIICYHCGDTCREDHVVFDHKDFCCNGCKTVYEILNQNDLCNYYDLNSAPGINLRSRDYGEKYDYLENKEIRDQLLSYQDDKIAKVQFYIPSIHCSSCIWLLENLHKLKEGVLLSRVNFSKKEISINYHPSILTLKDLVRLLATLGYEPFISLEQGSAGKSSKHSRDLIVKIGVAGFSFGNIMLLSFPEYFGFQGIENEILKKFFIWLNVLLSLPVVFYCSLDYFRSAWAGISKKFFNIDVPISLGIISLFTISLYYVFTGTGQGYFDSLSGLLFFLLIGKWIQSFTYEGLSFERNYRSYFPLAMIRLVDGKETIVPVKDLKKGDLIKVRNSEIIPTDSILLENSARIDYSFVTGESDPVTKTQGDHIYAGGRLAGSSKHFRVEKEVSQSYLTQLWNNEIFQKDKESDFQHLVDSISRYFTIIILLIAIISLLTWLLLDPEKAWFVFTAVLIVACPCALALATPFTLGNTLGVFGKNHFYLKNPGIIEKMVNINHIVFDKTGTLTENTRSEIEFMGSPLTDHELFLIQSMVSHSVHPLSRKILQYKESKPLRPARIDQFSEEEGKGLQGEIDHSKLKIGSYRFIHGEGSMMNPAPGETSFEHSSVYVSINDAARGFFRIKNSYRDHLDHLIPELGKKYRLSVLSGDHDGEKPVLEKKFPMGTRMLFRQQPEDKLVYIKSLKEKNDTVLMLGDGLNDAGALKQSDIGIAVTEDITSFTPASDAILAGEKLKDLHRFLRFAFTARHIIVASFIISFFYNVVGLGFAVTGNLTPIVAAILMPVSSISVVGFSTFAVRTLAKLKNLI